MQTNFREFLKTCKNTNVALWRDKIQESNKFDQDLTKDTGMDSENWAKILKGFSWKFENYIQSKSKKDVPKEEQ